MSGIEPHTRPGDFDTTTLFRNNMSWPRAHEGKVMCYGFNSIFLPTIQRAVDEGMVVWGKSSLFMDLGVAQFDWADCTWELEEMRECVTVIRLVKGTPTEQDLTAAVLRG